MTDNLEGKRGPGRPKKPGLRLENGKIDWKQYDKAKPMYGLRMEAETHIKFRELCKILQVKRQHILRIYIDNLCKYLDGINEMTYGDVQKLRLRLLAGDMTEQAPTPKAANDKIPTPEAATDETL